MTPHTDTLNCHEAPHAVRALDKHLGELFDAADADRLANVEELSQAFLKAAAECNAQAPAAFARTRRDWRTDKHRIQTVAEVLQDALECKDFMPRALQILMNAAQGKGTQRDAQILLNEAIARWADLEVE
jgi:chorismate mutase